MTEVNTLDQIRREGHFVIGKAEHIRRVQQNQQCHGNMRLYIISALYIVKGNCRTAEQR